MRPGRRKRLSALEVPFRYKNFLGHRKGADGEPEIVPEEAAIVKRIFHHYLAGDSTSQIAGDLETDGIPTARGAAKWNASTVWYMLQNEKYIGDAELQKTYVDNVLPKYYITNNHSAIIERDIFQKVQEEIARRGIYAYVQISK